MTDAAAKKKSMLLVGECTCPLCGRETPFKQQSTGFAAISCNWCGFQGYARSDESDSLMRKKWLKEKPAEPAASPKEEPKAEGKKKSGGWAD